MSVRVSVSQCFTFTLSPLTVLLYPTCGICDASTMLPLFLSLVTLTIDPHDASSFIILSSSSLSLSLSHSAEQSYVKVKTCDGPKPDCSLSTRCQCDLNLPHSLSLTHSHTLPSSTPASNCIRSIILSSIK